MEHLLRWWVDLFAVSFKFSIDPQEQGMTIRLFLAAIAVLTAPVLVGSALASDRRAGQHKKIGPSERQQAHERWRNEQKRRNTTPADMPKLGPPVPGPEGISKPRGSR